jgi:hypothetical protein
MVGFNGDTLLDIFKNAVLKKPIGSTDTLKTYIHLITQDLTFLEVYQKNGWILNITVTDKDHPTS